MRAESFYNFATYIEGVSDLRAYGGKSLHEQSHGESFISLFANRFEQGIYILDEPEAALSPQRQLSLLKLVHDLATPGHAQFIIATHSPIILSYGTLTNHAEAGEELFEVFIDPQTDEVKYRIRATSWPRATLARLGQPIVRALQARFRSHSLAAMKRATGAVGTRR